MHNLKDKGMERRFGVTIHQVGDVMYDAALFYKNLTVATFDIAQWIKTHEEKGFYLATVHRVENTDNPEYLYGLLEVLQKISKKIPIILPLHPVQRANSSGNITQFISFHRLDILI